MNNCIIFCVVRNPYSSNSAYNYLKQTEKNKNIERMERIGSELV